MENQTDVLVNERLKQLVNVRKRKSQKVKKRKKERKKKKHEKTYSDLYPSIKNKRRIKITDVFLFFSFYFFFPFFFFFIYPSIYRLFTFCLRHCSFCFKCLGSFHIWHCLQKTLTSSKFSVSFNRNPNPNPDLSVKLKIHWVKISPNVVVSMTLNLIW